MMMRSNNNRVVPDISAHHPVRAIPASFPNSPGGRWGLSPQQRPKRKDGSKDSPLSSPRTPRRILKSLRNHAVLHLGGPVSRSTRLEQKRESLANRNLTQFLTADCPTDVLPKILAYAGPNSAAALQQTSRHFCEVLNSEGTWRGLCEELYKVRKNYCCCCCC